MVTEEKEEDEEKDEAAEEERAPIGVTVNPGVENVAGTTVQPLADLETGREGGIDAEVDEATSVEEGSEATGMIVPTYFNENIIVNIFPLGTHSAIMTICK